MVVASRKEDARDGVDVCYRISNSAMIGKWSEACLATGTLDA
jgi:hypothetical protein